MAAFLPPWLLEPGCTREASGGLKFRSVVENSAVDPDPTLLVKSSGSDQKIHYFTMLTILQVFSWLLNHTFPWKFYVD
jgi:hypothetical protein